jgi:chromosome segregation ATPase
MDAPQALWFVLAAAGGAVVGAAACWVPMKRNAALLRDRIERAEQARNGAVERSAQAREQIAQLNKAITDLRRAHSMRGEAANSAEDRLAAAERALADARGDEKTLVMPRSPPPLFADTEVLGDKR